MTVHTHETLSRINTEWPNPLSHGERKAVQRERAIRHLEDRLGISVDRTNAMLGAMGAMELFLMTEIRDHRYEFPAPSSGHSVATGNLRAFPQKGGFHRG